MCRHVRFLCVDMAGSSVEHTGAQTTQPVEHVRSKAFLLINSNFLKMWSFSHIKWHLHN